MKSIFFQLVKFFTGIILLILNISIWINGFFINRGSDGNIILAVPFLIAGAFLLLGWYKTSSKFKPSKQQRRKFVLRVLVINYVILYLLYVIQDIIYSAAIDFMSMPGIILPVLLGLFVTGFILSWDYELYAGFFFLAWYALTVYSTFNYFEISDRGPHFLFGLTILIHGILYATNPYNKRSNSL